MHLTPKQRAALERGWFAKLPPLLQSAMEQEGQYRRYVPGSTIHMIGDEPGGYWGLLSGCVRVWIAGPEHGPYFVDTLWPGEWGGEAGMLGERRQVILSAAVECTTIYVARASIHAIVQRHPEHWNLFSGTLLGHLRVALTALSDALLASDEHRVIAVLLRLAGARSATPEPFLALAIPATQSEIGVMANASRTTTNRVLKELRDASLITAGYGKVAVLEPDRLRQRLA